MVIDTNIARKTLFLQKNVVTRTLFLRLYGRNTKNQKEMRTRTFITTTLCIILLTGCIGNNTTAARNRNTSIVQTLSQFKGIDDVEYLDISGPLLGIGKLFAKDALDGVPMNKIKSINILEAEGAADNVREEIIEKVGKALTGYEILMSAKDDGDDVTIYADMDDDIINELILFVKNEATVIALSGKLSLKDVSKLIND